MLVQSEQRDQPYAVSHACCVLAGYAAPSLVQASACRVAVSEACRVAPPCRARMWSSQTDSQRLTARREGGEKVLFGPLMHIQRVRAATQSLEWLKLAVRATGPGSIPGLSRAHSEATLTATRSTIFKSSTLNSLNRRSTLVSARRLPAAATAAARLA